MERLGALAGLLAPIAFVFGISAYSQVGALRKEMDRLRTEVEKLKSR